MRSKIQLMASWMTLPAMIFILMVGEHGWRGAAWAQTTPTSEFQTGWHLQHLRVGPSLRVDPQGAWVLRWRASSGGRVQPFSRPQWEYGLLRKWTDEMSWPVAADFSSLGTATTDLGLRMVYDLNRESMVLPAFGISARAGLAHTQETPFRDWDAALNFSATKTLGGDSFLQHIKLSAAWIRNLHIQEDEGNEYYAVMMGYDCQIGTSAEVALNWVHEEQKLKDADYDFVESGFRYHLTPNTMFWVGAGTGVGPGSPAFRGLFGLRGSF